MYVEVGSDVGSAGYKGLIVNAPVWRGGERLLLTCIPRPSLYKMHMERG
jgi:hypothetical protein